MLGWLLQELGSRLLVPVLLVCLGLLLGAAGTTRVMERKFRRLNELNEELKAALAARRQQGQEPTDDDLRGGTTGVDPSDFSAVSSAKTASDPISAGTSGTSQRTHKSRKVWLSIAREQGSGRDNPVQTTLPITIYLSDESAHEQVEAAVEDLLVATGGHIEHRDDPVLGSWFRRMRAKVSEFVDSPLGDEVKNLAAHTAESRFVHAQDATVTATMLQNLGPVLAAIQPTKEAVIRAGALLIVKRDSTLVVHQLTPVQQLQLDHQPQLAQSPHDILSALKLQPSSSAQSADGMDSTCGSAMARRSLNGDPAPARIVSNDDEASPPRDVAD